MKKMKSEPKDVSSDLEKFIAYSENENYHLKLYVSGFSNKSVRAIENLKKICEENLKGRYTLEIIDLYQNPELAKESQVIAAPTLIRKLPLPLRRFIGDLSDIERVVLGLDIKKMEK